MHPAPLTHEAKCPRRKRSRVDIPSGDDDESFIVAVVHVEVRRRVVLRVHVDHEAVQGAQAVRGAFAIIVERCPVKALAGRSCL